MTVIKQSETSTGKQIRVLECSASSYDIQLMYNGSWMSIEMATNKSMAIAAYKSFGGK